jgi:tetratricopeptide (TPR) repeat protein
VALSDVYTTLGFVMANSQRLAQAEKPFRRALELRKGLAEEFPKDAERVSYYGAALHNVGWSLEAKGQKAEAVALYRQAIERQRAAFDTAPQHPMHRKYLASHYHNLLKTQLELGKHREAAQTAIALPALLPENGPEHLRATHAFLRCMELAKKDTGEPDGAQLAEAYADKAMTMLREAVTNGYHNVTEMKTAPWLGSLRSRDDFQNLLAEVEKK